MSEREKHRTRGAYFLARRASPRRRSSSSSSSSRPTPPTAPALANLALAHFYSRDMARALEVGRRAVELSPQQRAAAEQRRASTPCTPATSRPPSRSSRPRSRLNPGFARRSWASPSRSSRWASATPRSHLEELEARRAGRSAGGEGLADLALYDGRLDDARALLGKAVAADGAGEGRRRRGAQAADARRGRARAGQSAKAAASPTAPAGRAQAEMTLARRAAPCVRGRGGPKALALADGAREAPGAEPQMYAGLVRGEASAAGGTCARRSPLRASRQAGRLLARALRARPGLPRGRRLHRGAGRARGLPQAAGRGDGVVPRRGARPTACSRPCPTTSAGRYEGLKSPEDGRRATRSSSTSGRRPTPATARRGREEAARRAVARRRRTRARAAPTLSSAIASLPVRLESPPVRSSQT